MLLLFSREEGVRFFSVCIFAATGTKSNAGECKRCRDK